MTTPKRAKRRKTTPITRSLRQPGAPYTVIEAAEYLRVSPRTIFAFLQRGLMRSSKAVRHRLIPAEDVETFVQKTA